MVWHHHRNSVRTYWKQQQGYGQAEAMLERKWPSKYNSLGHLTWSGRLYGNGLTLPLGRVSRIYQGVWGLAPFQQLANDHPSLVRVLPLMPEWYLVVAALALLSLLGFWWRPLQLALLLFLIAVAAPIAQACVSAHRARFVVPPRSTLQRWSMRLTVACLHLLQPMARLWGRLRHGLTLWRQRGPAETALPTATTFPIWIGRWRAPEERLHMVQTAIQATGAVVVPGGDYDRWDMEVRGGVCGRSRLLMAFEDSGSGTQLVRVRTWPRCSSFVALALAAAGLLSLIAAIDGAYGVSVILGLIAALLAWRMVRECGVAKRAIEDGLALSEILCREPAVPALEGEQEQV
jgi:hypothetical protein